MKKNYKTAFGSFQGERPPKVSQRTLDEMMCGRRSVGGDESQPLICTNFDRATEWLNKQFNLICNVQFINRGGDWTVAVQAVTRKGQRLVFTEPALDFPTDMLMSQLMLVDQ